MWELIKADLHRVVPGKFNLLNILRGFRSKGFKYMFFCRIAGRARYSFVRLIFRVILRRYTYKYGFQIPPQSQIMGGFFIGHFGTLVISSEAVIGENCNVAHGVTIGATRRGPLKGAPHIGNNVWIGTGAVVVGKIQVGNNVLIAPNAYVNMDIPPHSLVLGNPAKIISKENPTRGYINNAYTSK